MDNDTERHRTIEASRVFLLMTGDYRISRNARALWYFNHLNSVVDFEPKVQVGDFDDELGILSILAKDANGTESAVTSRQKCLVSTSTVVTFIAKRYRIVFVLDVSPSVATVDLEMPQVLYDEIFSSLQKTLRGLVNPLHIAGSNIKLQPQLCVTVIAHTPLANCKANQVLVQGFLVTSSNVEDLLTKIERRLADFEDKVAHALMSLLDVTGSCYAKDEDQLSGGLFEDIVEKPVTPDLSLFLTTPDVNFVNMFRYGILALQLLPEEAASVLVLLTDGVVGVPETSLFQSLLSQLRHFTTSCSIIQLGSSKSDHPVDHPLSGHTQQRGFGQLPYPDLLRFMSAVTFGVFFTELPETVDPEKNVYHDLLVWSFQKPLQDMTKCSYSVHNQHSQNRSRVPCDRCLTAAQMMCKRHTQKNLHTSITNLISCRLREGYVIRDVSLTKGDSQIEVNMLLPWRDGIRILYQASSSWPLSSTKRVTHAEVSTQAHYNFLHDMVFTLKKPLSSPYRTALVKKYWQTLQGTSETDELLIHLQSFSQNSLHYNIPESVRKGVPLFYLPPNSNPQVNKQLSSKDSVVSQFAAFWKPVLMLDINVWQKWMHTHRVCVVLHHDAPLAKHMHVANKSGRYDTVSCRHAHAAFLELLQDVCSFQLLEAHSYVRFIQSNDGGPSSFYLLRIANKPPCIVLRIAFLGGTPGKLRNKTIHELEARIASLSIPQRGSSISTGCQKDTKTSDKASLSHASGSNVDKPCAKVFTKPIDKILIRYEKMPLDLLRHTCLLSMPRSLSGMTSANRTATSVLATLSRYLFHRRWIWSVQPSTPTLISMAAVGKILNTLTRIRLEEGFTFAHASSGIINMVLEVTMKVSETSEMTYPSVMQYIIFPPHTTTTRESASDEDAEEMETTEADGELQIVTECWVEPQEGSTVCSALQHFDQLTYDRLTEAIFPVDFECISSMLTFEHLRLICESPNLTSERLLLPRTISFNSTHQLGYEARRRCGDVADVNIQPIPFAFDLLGLLPRCQQVQLLFSTFLQDSPGVRRRRRRTTGGSSDGSADVRTANSLLFSFLLDGVRRLHDREVQLDETQCSKLSTMLLKHDRKQCDDDDEGNDGEGLQSAAESQESGGKRWNCFVSKLNPAHIVVTFVPASYDDLRLLAVNLPAATTPRQTSDGCRDSLAFPPQTGYGQADIDEAEGINLGDNDAILVPDSATGMVSSSNAPISSTPAKKHCRGSPPFLKTDKIGDVSKDRSSSNQLKLPIYVFNCPLSRLTEGLVRVDDQPEDIVEDFTLQTEESQAESVGRPTSGSEETSPRAATGRRLSEARSGRRGSGRQSCGDCDQLTGRQWTACSEAEQIARYGDQEELRQHCTQLSEMYLCCFVKAVYESLRANSPVSQLDLVAAIDKMCEESAPLELDTTRFLHAVCGHVRQWTCSGGQRFESPETEDDCLLGALEGTVINGQNEDHVFLDERARRQPFPLSLLKTSECEHSPGLHSLIHAKFDNIVQQFFKSVPSNPDFYFYCPPNFHEKRVSMDSERLNVGEPDTDYKMASDTSEIFMSTCEDELGSERDSVISNADSATLSSLVDDAEGLVSREESEDDGGVSPLFIYLTCSVRSSNGELHSIPVRNLPVCLSELVDCLRICKSLPDAGSPTRTGVTDSADNYSQDQITDDDDEGFVNLSDMRITLDVTCLTLPPDTSMDEADKQTLDRLVSLTSQVSHASTSPAPSDDRDLSMPATEFGLPHGSLIDPLNGLPHYQRQAVIKVKEQIEWLLRDEIASALRLVTPVTAATLELVANHVRTGAARPTCMCENVRLLFVYRPQDSLEQFIKDFERMSLPGYHLTREGSYYYVHLNRAHANKISTALHHLTDVEAGTTAADADADLMEKNGFHGGTADSSEVLKVEDVLKSADKMEDSNVDEVSGTEDQIRDGAAVDGSPLTGITKGTIVEDESGQKMDEVVEDTTVVGATEVTSSSDITLHGTTTEVDSQDTSFTPDDDGDEGEGKIRTSPARLEETGIDVTEISGVEEEKEKGDDKIAEVSADVLQRLLAKSANEKQDAESKLLGEVTVKTDADVGTNEKLQKAEFSETHVGDVVGKQAESVTSTDVVKQTEDIRISITRPSPVRQLPVRTASGGKLVARFSDDCRLGGSDRVTVATPRRRHRSGESVLGQTSSICASQSLQLCADNRDLTRVQSSIVENVTTKATGSLSNVSRSRHQSGLQTPKSMSLVDTTSSRSSVGEEGYEGDSSDSDEAGVMMSFSDSTLACPVLANFWLIMRIANDRVQVCVQVYFHTRSMMDDSVQSDEPMQQHSLYKQVVQNIRAISRTVNQRLLLQELYETRFCSRLLVPADDADLRWDDREATLSNCRRAGDSDDSDSSVGPQRKYLAAEQHFMPGHFACDCKWQKCFELHPRLKMVPGRTGVSRGIQALRSVLNKFSVNNRKNMFVIQESNEAVFYIRLNESNQELAVLGAESQRTDVESVFSGGAFSRSSSLLSIPIRRMRDMDDDCISTLTTQRSRRLSSLDCDSEMTGFTSPPCRSANYQRRDNVITLAVYGICPVSPEISVNLMQMLQKKLDDSVLDMLSVTLGRNPMCKLNPEDVHFIQRPLTPPCTLRLTIAVSALLHQHALASYLRQTLLQFCYTPKFTDPECVFNNYHPPPDGVGSLQGAPVAEPIPEADVMLYNTPQQYRAKGIACLRLSFVDGRGNPVQLLGCPKPSSTAYTDIIDRSMFDGLVNTSVYEPKPDSKTPGPAALIQLDIWQRGDVDLPQLSDRLQGAVRHAVADIVTEYRLLTAPICQVPEHYARGVESPLHSAPASPGHAPEPRIGSSGQLVRQHTLTSEACGKTPKEKSSFSFQSFMSRMAIGRDATKNDSTMMLCTAGIEDEHQRETEFWQNIDKYERGDKGILQPMFCGLMQQWLQFCISIGSASVSMIQRTVSSRFPIDYILREIQMIIADICSDTSVKVFRQLEAVSIEGTFLPYIPSRISAATHDMKSESSLDLDQYGCQHIPGRSSNFLVIGRNVQQWRTSIDYQYVGVPPEIAEQQNLMHPKTHKHYQRFQPIKPDDDASSQTAADGAASSTPGDNSADYPGRVFVPRQRLLLIDVQDKEFTVYMYNWSVELQSQFTRRFSRLIHWHNARSHFLGSLICHKMGLFQHNEFSEIPPDPHNQEPNPFVQVPVDAQSLVKYTAPPLHHGRSSSSTGRSLRPTNFDPGVGPRFGEMCRNRRPALPMQQSEYRRLRDPVHRHGAQWLERRGKDKSEFDEKMKLEKLFMIWQQRMGPSQMPIAEDSLRLLKDSSRLLHNVATPLLFCDSWRRTLEEVPSTGTRTRHASQNSQEAKSRSRHGSGTSAKSRRLETSAKKPTTCGLDSPEVMRSSLGVRAQNEEAWHIELRKNFVSQYIQYLQRLGFVQVQTKVPSPRKFVRIGKACCNGKVCTSNIGHTYLQKTLPGGIMLIELGFREVYFCINVYALECSRIPLGKNVNPQLAVIFTDECDKFKDLTHVHSFSHDFHLRALQAHLGGGPKVRNQPTSPLRPDFHVTAFLRHFVHHFPYAPSFARSRVCEGAVTINDINSSGVQLFDYMLKHDTLYDMQAVRILTEADSPEMDGECVLVTQLSCDSGGDLVSGGESAARGGTADHRRVRADSYNVGLVIAHDWQAAGGATSLSLRYWVVLTQRDESFPKLKLEKTLGMAGLSTTKIYPAKVGWFDSPNGESDDDQTLANGSDRVNYLGYSNADQAPIYSLLLAESKRSKRKIEEMVRSSMAHCRRDILWQRLLYGEVEETSGRRKHRSDPDDVKHPMLTQLSFTEFEELLNFVTRFSLCDLDPALMPLHHMSMPWYHSLVRVLRTKYAENHRYFATPDGSVQYVVAIEANLDILMMLAIDTPNGKVELCAVHPEGNQQTSCIDLATFAALNHVEAFVNVCCFHIWSGIL